MIGPMVQENERGVANNAQIIRLMIHANERREVYNVQVVGPMGSGKTCLMNSFEAALQGFICDSEVTLNQTHGSVTKQVRLRKNCEKFTSTKFIS